MVIITDANGNIQTPTIPENVYQGSNLANEIVFLAPLPQTNVATITFRLPNGVLIEEQTMTPYNDVPGNYSGWKYVLNDVITQYYGQVTFQIHLYGGTSASEVWIIKDEPSITGAGYYTGLNFKSAGQTFNSWTFVVGTPNEINYSGETAYISNTGWVDIRYKRVEFFGSIANNLKNWLLVNAEKQQSTLVTTVAGTFPVLRGVPRLPHSTPSQESWNEILNWVAEANSRIADYDSGNILSKAILPYDSNFIYPLGATVYDRTTKAIYTSLSDNNSEHELSNTEYWGKTQIYEISPQDMEDAIDAKIQTHNESNVAHQDIRNFIATKQDQLSQTQLDAVNSGIDSTKVGQIATNTNDITNIKGKIPAEASSTNQLADKSYVEGLTSAIENDVDTIESYIMAGTDTDNQLTNESFVNSSIATSTATFKGTYNIVTDLGLTTSATEQQIATVLASEISSADDNDYCYVAYPDATDPNQYTKYDRYKYNGSAWAYEYTLNNSSFTAQQWASINSGITAQKVAEIDDKVDKDQTATKTTAGLVWAWEDGDGFHIWNIDPNEVHYTVEENVQGGLSVVIKTTNYEIEENEQGGLSVIIGGEENE